MAAETGLERGDWHAARSGTPALMGQEEEADALAQIGYADGVSEAPEEVDVTHYDPLLSFGGLNFYVSGQAPEAFLMDMQGHNLHHWSYDSHGLWPELERNKRLAGLDKWRRAHLYPNGDLLVIHEGLGMLRLDRDSKLIWSFPGRTHHDMHVLSNGHIWTLGREVGTHSIYSDEELSMLDVLIELDRHGQELQRVSLLDCLRNADSELLDRTKFRDLFHANSIEVLDGQLASQMPAFAAGNILVSLRHLNAVVVVDVEQEKVVWTLKDAFRWQHDAQITGAGTLLLFDNNRLPVQAPVSRVLEFDPLSKNLLWSFEGSLAQPFYSKTCGTTQRLGNGNTLIVESDGGRAFEIMANGTLVWEFFNPHRAGPQDEFIASLYALHRVGTRADFDWLPGPED